MILLGTGHAMVLNCYNTCFLLKDTKGEMILVDTGGGNQILKRLEEANADLKNIHHIILSHQHTDHILGIFWIIRKMRGLLTSGKYEGNLTIYMHQELEQIIRKICEMILPKKFLVWIDDRIRFQVVEDRQVIPMNQFEIEFLDIKAKKDKEFGFRTILENGKSFVFLGDETFCEDLTDVVKGADWLLHESYCLDQDAERFKPYEKMHSTVKTACQIAEKLEVKNLVLYHTEDSQLETRKGRYTKEGKEYFSGNIYVPDDLEKIKLT